LKFVLAGLLLFLPAVVGSVAAAAAATPRTAPSAAPFAWVPEGGFPDRFPFGQCTYWAAYNHPVTWNGDARDWLRNAQAQGVGTADLPSVGAVAVYRPGGLYSDYGHVAIVIAVAPSSYTVSEMNAPRWGEVSTRVVPWPDPGVQGFIPLGEVVDGG
jgi:surface antigen